MHITKLSKFFRELLDWILPQDARVKELEEMTPEEFRSRAYPCEGSGALGGNIVCLFSYRDPLVKTAIWELKYRGNPAIAKLLSALLYEEMLSELSDESTFHNFKNPIFIPIPLSQKRRRERGFNQCELITDALQKIDCEQTFAVRKNILVKIKHTESQTRSVSKRARSENLRDCFAIRNISEAQGKNIILFDDVLTTGATLGEARKTLLQAGAKKVISFTLAH